VRITPSRRRPVLEGSPRISRSGDESDVVCDTKKKQMTDERKEQPVMGMTILRTVRRRRRQALWNGGCEILDPHNCKTLQVCGFTPLDGGKGFRLRGYIGPV